MSDVIGRNLTEELFNSSYNYFHWENKHVFLNSFQVCSLPGLPISNLHHTYNNTKQHQNNNQRYGTIPILTDSLCIEK